MFVSQFDGNNKNISLTISSSNKTLSSLFGYIGTNGIVKNINLNCNITSTLSDVDNNIYVAGIAQFNYGTISNVIVTGTVSTEYNFASATIFNAGIVAVNYGKVEYVLSKANVLPKNNLNIVYAGGIATINYGTIEKSGFVGIAKGQIVGGIAGQNIKKSNSLAKITECYYQTDSTLQTQIESRNSGSVSNYAGGIVGYMEGGEISYCYTNGKITGSSSSTNSNINANIGGIVGYAKNSKESIKNCYVVGYNGSERLVDGTGTYVNVGVIIGDNNVDASYGNIYCLLDSSNGQSIIGNTSHYFDNAQSVSNIRTYLNKLGSSYFENDTVTNYLKLKNANYN